MKLVLVSLATSLFFAIFAVKTFCGIPRGPFFINTSLVLSQYQPLLTTNQALGQIDENIQKKMAVFDDSISRVISTLENVASPEKDLLELLNMESNVTRHKMQDSARIVANLEIQNSYEKLDREISSFCVFYEIDNLFGSATNFVVFGSRGRADYTDKFMQYLGIENEQVF